MGDLDDLDDSLQRQASIIRDNPIGNGLNTFRDSFKLACENAGVFPGPDALDQLSHEDIYTLSLSLVTGLVACRASRRLHPSDGKDSLFVELLRVGSAIISDDFDLDRLRPLFSSAITNDARDASIWLQVCRVLVESTPPAIPPPSRPSLPRTPSPSPSPSPPPPPPPSQTPWQRNTYSFSDFTEYERDVNVVLGGELGSLYIGIPGFRENFSGRVARLDTASLAVFKMCTEGNDPLFREYGVGGEYGGFHGGWKGWPIDANPDAVLTWLSNLCDRLAAFAKGHMPGLKHGRRPLAQAKHPVLASTAEPKLDIGFVDDPTATKDSRLRWSHMLAPGVLKSNPEADDAVKAWLDLGRCARKVLSAQYARRFVLGFTMCGTFMRIWEYDRLGGMASESFDINDNGLHFVFVLLGFLCMGPDALGFDPTITKEDGQRFIRITRKGKSERLVLTQEIMRSSRMAGRGTTCWRARREGTQTSFVVKDSWQFPLRADEGQLLKQATEKGVVNISRHYHHETVRVRYAVDDVLNNIRGGLDMHEADDYQLDQPRLYRDLVEMDGRDKGHSDTLPPRKRRRLGSPALPNRVHCRVIVRDYGTPIYEARTPSALLAAISDCIEGHKSLRDKAGLLHRDISMYNLMMGEGRGFLIDLDNAVYEDAISPGTRRKVGTKAFMAVGALLGEQHSFMHDLESFFWTLFWICIHYNGPDESKVVSAFDAWSHRDASAIALIKTALLPSGIFGAFADMCFTDLYRPLIPWMCRLGEVVFPDNKRWETEDPGLYGAMTEVLGEAQRALEASTSTGDAKSG